MAQAILLDADLSPAVALRLRDMGYDAVSVRDDPDLIRLSDEALLAHATRQRRVLVTYNVRDFVALSRRHAHAEREHAGLVLIHTKTIAQSAIGRLIHALDALFREARDLRNQTIFLHRAPARPGRE